MGVTEKVKQRGYWQWGLFNVVNLAVTNFNACLVKLDTDTLGDNDYSSTLIISSPTIGTTFGKNVKPNGAYLGDIVSLCKQLRTNFNLLMDKLAADGTVNGTTAYTDLKFAATAVLIDVSNARAAKLGEHQDALVQFLDSYITKWGSALGVLDADTGVGDTDYFSLEFVSDVVEASSSSSSSSCRSSSSCSSSSCSSSSSCRSSSSSSSSSCRSSSSSSCRSSSSSCSSSCSSSSSSSSQALV